jgi:hypothetical protein
MAEKNKKLAEIHEIKAATEKRAAEEQAMCQSQKVDSPPKEKISLNEVLTALRDNQDGDAQLFIRLHKNKMVFDHSENRWFLWKDGHWKPDSTSEAVNSIKGLTNYYKNLIIQIQKIKAKSNDGFDGVTQSYSYIEKMLQTRIHDLQTLKRKNCIFVPCFGRRRKSWRVGRSLGSRSWIIGMR